MKRKFPGPFTGTPAWLFAACAVLFCAHMAAAFQARNPTPPGRSTAQPTPPPARTTPPAASTTPAPRPTAQPTPSNRATFATPTPTPAPGLLTIRHRETTWGEWLWLLGGVLFFAVAGYMVYSAMLYNVVGSNRHPANFRKLLTSLVLLLSVVWFGYVFWQAFGPLMLIILFAVWLGVALVFIFTKRKPGIARQ